MEKCKICQLDFNTIQDLGRHIKGHNITSKEYYDRFLKREGEGICPECGKETTYKNMNLGYKKYCSLKCSNSSKEVQLKQQATTMKHYGVKHPAQSKEIMQKMQDTCIDLYGAANGHGEEQKEKMRQKCLAEHRVEYSWQREDVKDKANKTKCTNGWYNRLGLEARYLPKLKEIYPDIIHHYKSDKYPFECDFYVPSKDLYIEFNVFYMHGGHWFDENNPKDIETLNYWKSKANEQYEYAIHIWTERDLEKKRCAEENNLNYLVFWYEDEIIKYIKQFECI